MLLPFSVCSKSLQNLEVLAFCQAIGDMDKRVCEEAFMTFISKCSEEKIPQAL